MVEAATMAESEAEFELDLHDAEAEGRLWPDVSTELLKRGVPIEMVVRMEKLWEATENFAGKVFRAGRIIIIKIVEFLSKNPKVAGSLAVAAAAFALSNAVPLIGHLLAPIVALVIGTSSIIASSSFVEMQQAALDFFKLLIDVFNVIFNGAA